MYWEYADNVFSEEMKEKYLYVKYTVCTGIWWEHIVRSDEGKVHIWEIYNWHWVFDENVCSEVMKGKYLHRKCIICMDNMRRTYFKSRWSICLSRSRGNILRTYFQMWWKDSICSRISMRNVWRTYIRKWCRESILSQIFTTPE
jgi:hypothetical protein